MARTSVGVGMGMWITLLKHLFVYFVKTGRQSPRRVWWYHTRAHSWLVVDGKFRKYSVAATYQSPAARGHCQVTGEIK